MSTLKRIAESAGYSLSTVSIVLRGNAEQRHISKATQDKIYQVARELGYKPNITARRLRNQADSKQTVAIFWATDYRVSLMTWFIKGVQDYISENHAGIEIVICPYSPGQLSEVATVDNLNLYSAAIICTVSREELRYVERARFMTPVVLYNRTSKKYCTVSTDSEAIGRKAAEVLKSRGCARAVVITDGERHSYTQTRVQSFTQAMDEGGLPVRILTAPKNSISQGVATAATISFGGGKCGVFTTTDLLGFGALRSLLDRGIGPDRCELVSIGAGDGEFYRHFGATMAVIDVPIHRMAYECVSIADMLINKRLLKPIAKVIDFSYCPRADGEGGA